jgi:iron complex outermembrane receptor protein
VEPLYGTGGEVLGEDIRAVPGRALGWGVTALWGREGLGARGGSWRWETGGVHRLPDVYERTANGLHHGTFRFEQGDPGLRAEVGWVGEGSWSRRWPRASGGPPVREGATSRRTFELTLQAYAGAYPRFIFLAPEARFAPVAHAGQIYAFQQLPVARAGGEWVATWTRRGNGASSAFLRSQAALLGAWTLHDGLGLPFTPPLKHDLSVGVQDWSRGGWGAWGAGLTYTVRAPSWVLARNEARTPGSQQWGGWISLQRGPAWRWILRINHITDRPYMDHASVYRALELPAQGRLIEAELRWTPAMRHRPAG